MNLFEILYNLFNCHVTYINNLMSYMIQVHANGY